MRPGIYKIVDRKTLEGPIADPENGLLCVFVFQKELEGCWIARYNSDSSVFSIMKQIDLRNSGNWKQTILKEIELCPMITI